MRVPRWLIIAGAFLLGILGLRLVFGRAWALFFPAPAQPIPFSHRIHADTKEIRCFFCHPSALQSSNAGIPPVNKCLLCHRVIAARFPPIARIGVYDRENRGIPWVRTQRIPDFTHFSHQIHLARGIDCGVCHGNVRAMDRIPLVNFAMGFCVDCHRQVGASTDCYTCHR